MTLRVLGPLAVDGAATPAPRDRIVLSALAVHPGEAVPAERLADALWGEEPPPSWPKVVQGCVLRLRRLLGRDAVLTGPGGYRLALAEDDLDVLRFERLVGRGDARLAAGDPAGAATLLEDALALWRGPALGDLDRWPPGRSEAARLEELRRSVQERLLAARLAAGDDVVARAGALAAEEPLRERRWELLARALYRDGRQAEALQVVRDAAARLRRELGLEPGAGLRSLERAILSQDPALQTAAGPTAAPAAGSCPYQGLAAYDAGDADRFFGRDADVARCLDTLRATSLLVVAGPSGTGKSSLVRAGLVPALAGEHRHVVVLTPGADPQAALAAATQRPAGPSLLVLDQAEELFTVPRPAGVAAGVLDRLAALAAGDALVVVVLRGDQVGALACSPDLARRAERGLQLLTPMDAGQLRDAVEGPARRAGLRLQPGLVELLVRDAAGEPGALPHLSHALVETWRRRQGAVLTVAGYRAGGGVRGAVAQSAERLHASLAPPLQAALRAVLLRLVVPSPDGDPVAVRVPWHVLAEDPRRRTVLDLLLHDRLVTADERGVAVAHEALLAAWPRMRTWFDEDVDRLRVLRHLSVSAEDWDAGGRGPAELYRGRRLEAALEARQRGAAELTAVESEFLDASAAQARAERQAAARAAAAQRRANRRLRRAVVAAVVALVLAATGGVLAAQQAGRASRAAEAAQVDRLVAESAALRSSRRDLAALLAVQAHLLRPGAATRGALLGLFTGSPGFGGYLPLPGGPARSGRLLADGRTVLLTGADGAASAVDVGGGAATVLRRFPPPGLAADNASLDVSDDGRTLAVVAWQGTDSRGGQARLSVLDVATAERRLPELDLRLDAGAVAVGPDGRYVAASGDTGGRVVVVDTRRLAAGGTTVPVGGAQDPPGVVQLAPLGTRPTAAGVRGTAAVGFTPDGLLVAGSPVGVVRLVDPATGEVVQRLDGAPPGTGESAVVQQGDVLVTTGPGGAVRWDRASGRPAWVSALDDGRCSVAAAVAPAGPLLCSGGTGRVEALDLADGDPVGARYDLQRGGVAALLPTPDAAALLELGRDEAVLARWWLDGRGPATRMLPVAGVPGGWSADGRLLLLRAAAQGPVEWVVTDAATGAEVHRLPGWHTATWTGAPDRLVAWLPDGNGWVLDARTGRRLLRLQGGLGTPAAGAAVAGRAPVLVAWGHGEGSLSFSVWDVSTGDHAGPGTRYGNAGSLTGDGSVLLKAHEGSGSLASHRVADGRLLATRAGVVAAAAAPVGPAAASTADGRLVFLDPLTLRDVGDPLPGTPGVQRQLVPSDDGALLAARGRDGAVRLVDVAARTALGEPLQLQDPASPVALRPDGGELAVPTAAGLALWTLDADRLLAAACEAAGRTLTEPEWRTHLPGRPYRPGCTPTR